MGVKSTYLIDRELAKQILLSKIMQMTYTELEDALEACKESEFRNYQVKTYREIIENSNKEFPNFSIQTFGEF